MKPAQIAPAARLMNNLQAWPLAADRLVAAAPIDQFAEAVAEVPPLDAGAPVLPAGQVVLGDPVATPETLGEPLDERFLMTGPEVKEASKADWQRRLQQLGGRASLIPIGPFDPRKDLLIVIPGLGMNYQDLHGLAALADTYQVLIGVSDEANQSIPDSARSLADAVGEVCRYRQRLGVEQGFVPSKSVRVIGHSFGASSSQLMLQELAGRGLLGDGEARLFSDVLYVPIDGPRRGIDAPVGAPPMGNEALKSIFNGSPGMDAIQASQLPPAVRTELVSVLGPLDAPNGLKNPIDSWQSAELAPGELALLWSWLRSGSDDLAQLRYDALGGQLHVRGLENLFRTLLQDHDGGAALARLRDAAGAADSPEAFAPSYDEILGSAVDTFHGRHTEFMWEDPTFMPFLRHRLAGG